MSGTGSNLDIDLHGPVFNGVAAEELAKMAEDCQAEVAKAAEDVWQSLMDSTFKWPTGYYQSHINIARREKDLVINDQGVIYGSWLERGNRSGTSSFQGYHLREHTLRYMDGEIDGICQPIVDKALEKINHG